MSEHKWKIATGILVVAIAYDTQRRIRKIRPAAKALCEENTELHEALQLQILQMQYLFRKLIDNGVIWDEFDRIAFNDPISSSK